MSENKNTSLKAFRVGSNQSNQEFRWIWALLLVWVSSVYQRVQISLMIPCNMLKGFSWYKSLFHPQLWAILICLPHRGFSLHGFSSPSDLHHCCSLLGTCYVWSKKAEEVPIISKLFFLTLVLGSPWMPGFRFRIFLHFGCFSSQLAKLFLVTLHRRSRHLCLSPHHHTISSSISALWW